MLKIQDFDFSNKFRQETSFMDFVNEVRNFINVGAVAFAAKYEATGQAGDIATTTLFTPGVAWNFRVSVYMICTTAGGGTLSCTIGWTDNVGAKTLSPAGSVDLASTANGSTGSAFIRAGASAITLATAIAGKTGSPQYAIYIMLEQLG